MLQEEMQKKENRKSCNRQQCKSKKEKQRVMAGNKAENKKLKSNQ